MRPPRGRQARIGRVPSRSGWHPAGDVWLIRRKNELTALERLCPHQGCPIKARTDDLWCPCHGSRFQRDGTRIEGPSPRNLVWFVPHVRGGEVYIDRSRPHVRRRWVRIPG